MSSPDETGTIVNGVCLEDADRDADGLALMARVVRTLPDELCQTMVSLRREGGHCYAVRMEDGLDRAELTQPIAAALLGALAGEGVRHDGLAVGDSTRIDPS